LITLHNVNARRKVGIVFKIKSMNAYPRQNSLIYEGISLQSTLKHMKPILTPTTLNAQETELKWSKQLA